MKVGKVGFRSNIKILDVFCGVDLRFLMISVISAGLFFSAMPFWSQQIDKRPGFCARMASCTKNLDSSAFLAESIGIDLKIIGMSSHSHELFTIPAFKHVLVNMLLKFVAQLRTGQILQDAARDAGSVDSTGRDSFGKHQAAGRGGFQNDGYQASVSSSATTKVGLQKMIKAF